MTEVAPRAGLSWRKSTWSGSGNCVQVARADTQVLVCDTKDPAGPILAFTRAEWQAFLAGAKAGEFDEVLL